MIIGLVGLAGSGKSTAAQYISEKYGYMRLNFKDGLVREIRQNFQSLLEELVEIYYYKDGVFTVDDLFRSKPPAMRKLMQAYGTEVRRRDDIDYWVNQWKAVAYSEPVRNIVTDDVRFLNEAEAVKDAGGKIIRIVRTDITEALSHSSETEQFNIVHDYEIAVGPGEHDKLYEEIDKIISS